MTKYSDGYRVRDYGQMVRDARRFQPWLDALRRRISPETTVMDIGCGTGILSLLACKFGARKVYAVEPDASIEIGRSCTSELGGGNRIEWIQQLSTDITLPEKVDLVVGDLHGTLPFFTRGIASLADARRRHLKPNGLLLPRADILYAAPATAAEERESIDVPWRNNPYGLDLSAALPVLVNSWWRALPEPIEKSRLLGNPKSWGTIDYTDEETRSVSATLEWNALRDASMDGFYVWFDGEVDEGLGFSNSPLLPELVYGRGFFPLERSIEVTCGDGITVRLAVNRVQDDWVYRWNTSIRDPSGAVKASFNQSTFKLLPGQNEALRKSESRYSPKLNYEGQIQRDVLTMMDGQTCLADMASALYQRYPERFPAPTSALAFVAEVSRAFG